MQVVFHIGAHCTDEDRLVRCLLKNRGKLAAEGIVVPGPSRYRPILRETMGKLRGGEASPDTQEALLDAVMDEDSANRIIFSEEHFIGLPDKVLVANRLYPQAGERIKAMANLFPQAQTEFHLAIRNPATFLPALHARQSGVGFEQFVAGVDLMALRWSDLIRRIREARPDCPLTVWCNEDTPLIWIELFAAVAKHDPEAKLGGMYDLLSEIMSPTGMKRLRVYLGSHPPQTILQRRRIVSAFLDKFGLADQIEQELDLPGWTSEFVEDLTDHYEDDIAEIERMDGVTFLAP